MRNLQRAQIGPVIWRVLAFSIFGGAAVLLLLTSGGARRWQPLPKDRCVTLGPGAPRFSFGQTDGCLDGFLPTRSNRVQHQPQ
jgi:hypothetical protein